MKTDLGLQDTDLLRTSGFIGDWCGAASGKTYEVVNPATGNVLAAVPRMDADDAARAVDFAAGALPSWKASSVDERSKVLRAWASLILEHRADLGRILTIEQGKPLTEAVGEVVYAASFVDWFAEEIARSNGALLPSHAGDKRLLVTREPVGVGAAITPWNFPAAMVTRKVAPALAAGCTIVMKPSEYSPLTALAFVELANRAGMPPGVFSVVVGAREDAASIGGVFTASPMVRKIGFTGSVATGKLLARASADTVKKLSLELGGNAPFIIFEDADLDAALDGLMVSKFRNAGQVCIAANRVLVHDAVHDGFVERFARRAAGLKVGNGLDDGVEMGPLITMAAVEKIERHIEDATAKGATVVTGGNRHALGRTFFEPTVLTGAAPGMLPFEEETFGPVASVCRFKTEEEAISIANDTRYGLAAYFYSNDRARCWRVAEALEAGIVCENTVAFSSARAPFGGYKESGIGREGGHEGLEEWQEVKYRCMGGIV